ncbi:unnamed protein product [Blepharisma stoltei]|uniref:Uncharacterized protein n=1 Tax=Blepharisma stoltei TaxID=1481888 RepID=A0AAU9IKV2_9CILI|nr:unnamed protein product [Blepharisma stoltei]
MNIWLVYYLDLHLDWWALSWLLSIENSKRTSLNLREVKKTRLSLEDLLSSIIKGAEGGSEKFDADDKLIQPYQDLN